MCFKHDFIVQIAITQLKISYFSIFCILTKYNLSTLNTCMYSFFEFGPYKFFKLLVCKNKCIRFRQVQYVALNCTRVTYIVVFNFRVQKLIEASRQQHETEKHMLMAAQRDNDNLSRENKTAAKRLNELINEHADMQVRVIHR